MRLALGSQARRFRLQQAHALRGIDDRAGNFDPRKPRLVIQADAHQQRRVAQARKLRRLELDRVRILVGRGEAVSLDPPAADGLDQRLEVGRGGDDLQG